MSSPNTIISPFYSAPENNQVSVETRQVLNQTSHFYFPRNLSPPRYYFSAPPSIYFFSNTCLPPPPSIWVYYPLWFVNPNPNHRHESVQEVLPPPYTPNPNQELPPPPTSSRRVNNRRGYRWRKNLNRRRKIRQQLVKSNVDDHITTVMLRNIPNRYTREMLIEFIDEQCEQANKTEKNEECPISAYDFVYLPIDFRSKLNKGYAFVNFTNAKAVSMFKNACNHMPWTCFRSRKVLEITSARIQGKDKLVTHFQQMGYPAEAYSAVCFNPARTGLGHAVQAVMVGKSTEPRSSV